MGMATGNCIKPVAGGTQEGVGAWRGAGEGMGFRLPLPARARPYAAAAAPVTPSPNTPFNLSVYASTAAPDTGGPLSSSCSIIMKIRTKNPFSPRRGATSIRNLAENPRSQAVQNSAL